MIKTYFNLFLLLQVLQRIIRNLLSIIADDSLLKYLSILLELLSLSFCYLRLIDK